MKAGQRRRDQIQRERHHEEPLATEAVGEVAEEERAEHGAGDVDEPGRPTSGCGKRERVLLSAGPMRADDRDLEPVEDPRRAERDDDQPVPARPGQAVEPRGDVRDDLLRTTRRRTRHGAHAGEVRRPEGESSAWAPAPRAALPTQALRYGREDVPMPLTHRFGLSERIADWLRETRTDQDVNENGLTPTPGTVCAATRFIRDA